MITEVPSVADRFQEINQKLDRMQLALGLLLAAIATLPVEIDAQLLTDLGWKPSTSKILKI